MTLDPHVFPSETRGRFRMLLAVGVVLTWSLGSALVAVPDIPIVPADISAESQAALDQLLTDGRRGDLAPLRPLLERNVPVFAHTLLRFVVSALFLLLVLGAATALCSLRTSALRRRYRSRPLGAEDAPTVVEELQDLALHVGLPEPPFLEWRPGFLDGLAFGPAQREIFVLSGEPRFLEKTWNDSNRVVALHELAHIVNGDVRSREVAWALWRALLLAVTAAAVVVALASLLAGELRFPVIGGPPSMIGLCTAVGRLTLCFLVFRAIWAGLVRAREHYADVRVAAWGWREPLLRRLRLPEPRVCDVSASASRSRRPSWRLRALRWLTALLWGHHPSTARRIAILDDASPLFRVPLGLAFSSGLLLGLVFGQVPALVPGLGFAVGMLVAALYVSFGPIALLLPLIVLGGGVALIAHWVTGALGVQVLRHSVAELVGRGAVGGLRSPALAVVLALGLELGLVLTPWGIHLSYPGAIVWPSVLIVLLASWLAHLHGLSRLWFASHAGPSPPSRAQRHLARLASGLLALLLGSYLLARALARAATDPVFLKPPFESGHPSQSAFLSDLSASGTLALALGTVAFLAIAACSLLLSYGWLAIGRTPCQFCGQSNSRRSAAVQPCRGCGRALATWWSPAQQGSLQ